MSRAFVAAVVLAAAFLVVLLGRPRLRAVGETRSRSTRERAPGEPGATVRCARLTRTAAASALFGPFTAGPDGACAGRSPLRPRGAFVLPATTTIARTLRAGDRRRRAGRRGHVSAAPDGPVLENDFVSSKGWVKPGETYPFTLRVLNYGATPLAGARVTVTRARRHELRGPSTGPCRPSRPQAPTARPGAQFKVVEARADTLAQDPEIVWKNLSSTATLTYRRRPRCRSPRARRSSRRAAATRPRATATARSRSSRSTTATASTRRRRPRPSSRARSTTRRTRARRSTSTRRSPTASCSRTATVPSEALATADWGATPNFASRKPQPQCTASPTRRCRPTATRPATASRTAGTSSRATRSTTALDGKGSALIGALGGVGALQDIDSGCGPTGKAVFDAAQIADPEIDYDRYDTDKDGVVDFFMMVFAGPAATATRSSTACRPTTTSGRTRRISQNGYTDANGEKGYVTDDQSHDLEGRPLFWTDASRTAKTTNDTGLPVYTRVGPVQRQPGVGDRARERDLARVRPLARPARLLLDRQPRDLRRLDADGHRLLAEHRRDRQEGARLARPARARAGPARRPTTGRTPSATPAGSTGSAPDGTPYTLTGDGIHNGEAYVATAARPPDASTRRSCPRAPTCGGRARATTSAARPTAGHNLDLALPGRPRGHAEADADVQVALGHRVGLRLRLRARQHRQRQDLHVAMRRPRATRRRGDQNPNANGCQAKYGNGITGSSGSYAARHADRRPARGQLPGRRRSSTTSTTSPT